MMEPSPATSPPDASPDNWVDRFAPGWSQAWLRLARADRPIGTWLLVLPCWWAVVLASVESGGAPDIRLMGLFALGALVMRGAGCAWNDLADRRMDAQVARTRSRPIASGAVSVRGAVIFLMLLLLAGLLILLQFNGTAVAIGLAAMIPAAVYPFAKRFTWWPQLFLGVAFNWGALVGWAAVTGSIGWPAVCLYAAGIFWTLGYDTIYAHQDAEDDALIGVRSSALFLGAATRRWVGVFYAASMALLCLSGIGAGIGWFYYAGLLGGGWHLGRQVAGLNIDSPRDCLMRFRSNRDFGLIVFLALLAGALMP